MVATSGHKPDHRAGRNGHRNNAMAARLIVPVHNGGGDRGRRGAESGTDQG
jgi:hypothetical protein